MITNDIYGFLDRAFEYFNEKLFENKVKASVITFHRKKGTYGYHHWDKFARHDGSDERAPEISLNPDTFSERDVTEILSTLVHEMVHNLMHVLDIAPRKGYHDKTFANMMYDIGLQVSSTGEEGGKTTGQKMSHYILKGGKFEVACQAFLLKEKEHGFVWDSVVEEKEKKEKKKTKNKFTCPVCMESATAKKDAKLVCGNCMEKMLPEEDED